MVTSRLWIITRREYLTNFRRPIYLFTAFGMPLIVGVILYIVFSVIADSETNLSDFEAVGYVDLSTDAVLANIEPDARFVSYIDVASAQTALSSNEIDAYFVVSPDYMINGGQIDFYAPTDSLPSALSDEINDLMIAGLKTQLPTDDPIAQLDDPFTIARFRILSDNSSFSDLSDFLARFLTPFGFAFFMFTTITITAQFLMSGVVEEKENRMMEILTTSCTVYDLLWGKMLGLGAIGLTQVLVWTVFGSILAAIQTDVGDFISASGYGLTQLGQFLGLYVLAYLLFAGFATSVGAIFTAEQEARQFAMVFNLIAVLPIAFIATFFSSGSIVAVIFLLIPLTAPVSILMVLAYGTVSMGWVYLSLAILIISVMVVMWGGARLFRAGMLMYGQRPNMRQIWQALRYGTT